MWAEQTGTFVDGVIAIDPVALSYILGAVGPITMPDGEVISKDNVVELTESTAYFRFPDGSGGAQAVLAGHRQRRGHKDHGTGEVTSAIARRLGQGAQRTSHRHLERVAGRAAAPGSRLPSPT